MITLTYVRTVVTGAMEGSGPIPTAPVSDVFGWTTFVVMAPRRTLDLADTEAGAFITVLTHKMSQYRAFRLALFQVKPTVVHFQVRLYVLMSLHVAII